MAALDPTITSLLDTSLTTRPTTTDPDSDIDEDALLSTLDDDPALTTYREARLQQLHTELSHAKQMRNLSHGTYTTLTDEKALMDITTSTKYCVVHFFKEDFARCGVMDGCLETLAPPHYETRFLRISVTHAPFLVTKLSIRVLPCVLAFADGVNVDRIVGFEGLGYSENSFTARDLEARLLKAGVLVREKVAVEGETRKTRERKKGDDRGNEDDDDDWD
ncbi:hypothetical protein MMC16_007630 [Acarospora aff. strigata]|nr:hypothetical protein [Acarospora aff. strigata]